MSGSRQHWVLVAAISLVIGSSISLLETSVSKVIDSLLPDVEKVNQFKRPGSITILSSDKQIIQKLGPATREKVVEAMMPDVIKMAFVAAEDRRFFEHQGVDLWGITRAIITNIRKRSVREGASTITQQLARTIFLSQDRTLTRKLKEAALAFKIERQLTKEKILLQYLNNVYLGSGAYGIADAAWVYFTKTPELLTLEEAALIAGLPPAPSLYSPLINPELAIKQRSIVLRKMYEEGFISFTEFSTATSSPLNLEPAQPKYFQSRAPFFTSWVAQELPSILTPEQLELGGLEIHTSLNLEWQEQAQVVIRENSPEDMEGALVAIQPETGLVRALVGGKNFQKNQFNRATQALRSPGSTFKLFTYAAAISSGFGPEDTLLDMPKCWYGYCPKNFGDKYMGPVSIADALKNSLNTIAVSLLDKVGFEKVIATANKLGIGNERKLGKYYPLAIGAYEQTLLDMTAAYAAVTNRGLFNKPNSIEKIFGPDEILIWSQKSNGEKAVIALSKEVADTMNWMLQRVVEDGTGIAASIKGRQIAGKTGTSEGNRDLWFIGSIPQLTTGIWFGYDDNKKTSSGSGEAALAWKKFMNKIEKNFQVVNFPERKDLMTEGKIKTLE